MRAWQRVCAATALAVWACEEPERINQQLVLVGEPGGPATITEALHQAAAAGTIVVGPGEYLESLELDRDVTIAAAEGAAVTICAEPGAVGVHVVAATVHLEGVTIDCGTWAGVWCEGAACTLSEVEVRGTKAAADGSGGYGVMAAGAGTLVLEAVKLTANADAGVLVSGGGVEAQGLEATGEGDGVRVEEGATATLVDVALVGNAGWGLDASGAGSIVLRAAPTKTDGETPATGLVRGNLAGGVRVRDPAPGLAAHLDHLRVEGGRLEGAAGSVALELAGARTTLEACTVGGRPELLGDGVRLGTGARLLVDADSAVSDHGGVGVLVSGAGAVLDLAGRVSGNPWGGVWVEGAGASVWLRTSGRLEKNGLAGIALTTGTLVAEGGVISGNSMPPAATWQPAVGDGVLLLGDAKAVIGGTLLEENLRAAAVVAGTATLQVSSWTVEGSTWDVLAASGAAVITGAAYRSDVCLHVVSKRCPDPACAAWWCPCPEDQPETACLDEGAHDVGTGLCMPGLAPAGQACGSASSECELEACDEDGGCAHEVEAGWCFIQGGCVSAGAPEPGNPCGVCQPEVVQDGWSNLAGAPCQGPPHVGEAKCSERICAWQGCEAGWVDTVPVAPGCECQSKSEACNGQDDDCDGKTDEEATCVDDGDPCTTEACTQGQCASAAAGDGTSCPPPPHALAAVCQLGTCEATACESGWGSCAPEPACETSLTSLTDCGKCDIACSDDGNACTDAECSSAGDCVQAPVSDGTPCEGPPHVEDVGCIAGVCSWQTCAPGWVDAGAAPGCECEVKLEVCNGADDDCDGDVDETGCEPSPPEVCNGKDDDGDGLTDEAGRWSMPYAGTVALGIAVWGTEVVVVGNGLDAAQVLVPQFQVYTAETGMAGQGGQGPVQGQLRGVASAVPGGVVAVGNTGSKPLVWRLDGPCLADAADPACEPQVDFGLDIEAGLEAIAGLGPHWMATGWVRTQGAPPQQQIWVTGIAMDPDQPQLLTLEQGPPYEHLLAQGTGTTAGTAIIALVDGGWALAGHVAPSPCPADKLPSTQAGFVARGAADGTLLWQHTYCTWNEVQSLAITELSGGDLAAAGRADGSPFVVRLAPDGSLRWARVLPQPGGSANALVVAGGSLLISGEGGGSTSLLARLDFDAAYARIDWLESPALEKAAYYAVLSSGDGFFAVGQEEGQGLVRRLGWQGEGNCADGCQEDCFDPDPCQAGVCANHACDSQAPTAADGEVACTPAASCAAVGVCDANGACGAVVGKNVLFTAVVGSQALSAPVAVTLSDGSYAILAMAEGTPPLLKPFHVDASGQLVDALTSGSVEIDQGATLVGPLALHDGGFAVGTQAPAGTFTVLRFSRLATRLATSDPIAGTLVALEAWPAGDGLVVLGGLPAGPFFVGLDVAMKTVGTPVPLGVSDWGAVPVEAVGLARAADGSFAAAVTMSLEGASRAGLVLIDRTLDPGWLSWRNYELGGAQGVVAVGDRLVLAYDAGGKTGFLATDAEGYPLEKKDQNTPDPVARLLPIEGGYFVAVGEKFAKVYDAWLNEVQVYGPTLTAVDARGVLIAAAAANGIDLSRRDAYWHGDCESAGACAAETLASCDKACELPVCGPAQGCQHPSNSPADRPCGEADAACTLQPACSEGKCPALGSARFGSWPLSATLGAPQRILGRKNGGVALLSQAPESGQLQIWRGGADGSWAGGQDPTVLGGYDSGDPGAAFLELPHGGFLVAGKASSEADTFPLLVETNWQGNQLRSVELIEASVTPTDLLVRRGASGFLLLGTSAIGPPATVLVPLTPQLQMPDGVLFLDAPETQAESRRMAYRDDQILAVGTMLEGVATVYFWASDPLGPADLGPTQLAGGDLRELATLGNQTIVLIQDAADFYLRVLEDDGVWDEVIWKYGGEDARALAVLAPGRVAVAHGTAAGGQGVLVLLDLAAGLTSGPLLGGSVLAAVALPGPGPGFLLAGVDTSATPTLWRTDPDGQHQPPACAGP